MRLCLCLLWGAVVLGAQQAHSWISGVGDDLNACTRTAPCATFAAAQAATVAGGVVTILDPGDFGPVTITKSLTLDGSASEAVVSAGLSTAIVVAAGATDVVTLRNLKLNGHGTGSYGIQFLAGAQLRVESCQVERFVTGMQLNAGVSALATVLDTRLHRNTTGIESLSGVATLRRVMVDGGTLGVALAAGVLRGDDLSITYNTTGIALADATRSYWMNSEFTHNGTAFAAATGAAGLLAKNELAFNTVALACGGATMLSAGSNRFAENGPTGCAPAAVANPDTIVQVITFAALPNQILPGSNLALVASASSGLPVALASTTPAICTVSGTTMVLLQAGTCTIAASQAGNGLYSAAPTVTRSFSITNPEPVAQTIQFAPLGSLPLTGDSVALVATASSGLPVVFASTTPTVCAVSGTSMLLLQVGTCSIRASQAGNGTYAAAPNVVRSFSVTIGNANRLFFSVQPTAARVNDVFPLTPAILVRDVGSNLVVTSTAMVALSIGTGPTGATLACGGTFAGNRIAAVAGVATFEACRVDKPGTYTLVATSQGLTSTTSAPFTVSETARVPAFGFLAGTLNLIATTGNRGGVSSMRLFADEGGYSITSKPDWLQVRAIPWGSGALFELIADAANLAPGSYTGQMVAELPAYSLRSMLELRLIVLGCSTSLNPEQLRLAPGQMDGGTLVGALPNCGWTASSQASWITVGSAASKGAKGNGTLRLQFAPNLTGQQRVGTVTVLNSTLTVTQPPSPR